MINYIAVSINECQKERELLKEIIFDDLNYDIHEDFPHTGETLFNAFLKIVEEKDPLIVGFDMNNFNQNLPAAYKNMEH